MAKFDTATKGSASRLIEKETSHSYWCPTGQKFKVWKLPGEVSNSLIRKVHEMKYTVIIVTEDHVFNCPNYRHSLSSSEENLYITPQEKFCSVALRGSLSPRHDFSSGWRWRRRLPKMELSCEYIDLAVADSRKGVVLLLGLE